jgi:UDP-glucose:glycoprotein glucosyltransferase
MKLGHELPRSVCFSVVRLPPHSESEPAFDIAAIVDPVSRGAQKVGPILSVLQEVLNCHIKVYFNCVEKHSDMPLKRYVQL